MRGTTGPWCPAPTEGSRGGNRIPGPGEGAWPSSRYPEERVPGCRDTSHPTPEPRAKHRTCLKSHHGVWHSTVARLKVHLTFPLLVPTGARLRSQSQRSPGQACSGHRPSSQCCAGVTPSNSSARTCWSSAGLASAAASPHGSAAARGRRDAVQSIPLGLHMAAHENPPVTQKRDKIPT